LATDPAGAQGAGGATAPPDPTVALRMANIRKAFGRAVVLDDVSLDVDRGEVLALLGENGAGKTTLMRIASGLTPPDAGEIEVWGRPVEIRSPADALAEGLGIVQQHFSLVGNLSVAENVVLGTRRLGLSPLSRRRAQAAVRDLGEQYGIQLDPARRVDSLSVDEQAKVEIVKALHSGARILILDEPTSSLGPKQIEELFEVVHRMTRQGLAVILVTHRLGEVRDIADRVIVLREGSVTEQGATEAFTPEALTRAMVGHDVVRHGQSAGEQPTGGSSTAAKLEVKNVALWGRASHGDGVSFGAHIARVLGVVGVEGNGQAELLEILAGLRRPGSGQILLDGSDVTGRSPVELHDRGMVAISGDRHRWDIVQGMSVADNFALHAIASGKYRNRWGLIDWDSVVADADAHVGEFDVRPRTSSARIESLSGGNQQKVVIARALAQHPDVLVLGQPTRGLDVGARQFVHDRVTQAREAGVAIVLISFDLDEVFDLADDIIVLFRGQISYRGPKSQASRDAVGAAMTGLMHSDQEAMAQ
jgi:general nucleoside transport system ATP-binding protein